MQLPCNVARLVQQASPSMASSALWTHSLEDQNCSGTFSALLRYLLLWDMLISTCRWMCLINRRRAALPLSLHTAAYRNRWQYGPSSLS